MLSLSARPEPLRPTAKGKDRNDHLHHQRHHPRRPQRRRAGSPAGRRWFRAAWTRGNERRAYRRLLECDDVLRDVGITRDDVRKAMAEWRH
jgi:uncharacterized protein YjiS (DUF1127 family)